MNRPKKNLHDVFVIILTILICALVAAAITYHFVSLHQQYLKGVSDGLNVKSISDLQNILTK